VTIDDGRHLTTAELLEHWDSGVPVLVPISGTPTLWLRIDPQLNRLTLRAPVRPEFALPANDKAHVAVETRVDAGIRYLEISTTDERLMVDGHSMLKAVADRIQVDGMNPAAALDKTLETWASILATRTRMSLQAEVGLFGELLVVRALLLGSVAPTSAWHGGLNEEHDFGLADSDVEVKTTTSETRRHWIHGLTQLVATGKTPLWLLSIQITRAGDAPGWRLPDLIDEVLATAPSADHAHIDQNLAGAGWGEHQRDLLHDRWRLRSLPAAFRVETDVPRLTPQLLADASVDVARLRQVNYEIDLAASHASGSPPPKVAAIIEEIERARDA
jgi:putative PD-(D/E)XK family protein DUF4420